MELFFLYCGFFGSWLLFAGPIFQAALELKDEDIERDRIRETAKRVATVQHVSPWWWLLPPVKLYLESVQRRRWQKEYFSLLLPEDREAFVDFTSKARGWLFVAGGALLIAGKETWELGEKLEWSHGLIFGVIVICAFVSLLYTVSQLTFMRKVNSTADN